MFFFTASERRIFKRREKLTVSQWAEKYREVTRGPSKGRWTNTLTPYLVGPMDAFSLPHIRKIYMCFAPQTGKTQAALNCMMYAIDQAPGPIMYVMPDEKVGKRLVNRQILPALKSSRRISDLLLDAGLLQATFKNGVDIMLAWATSAASMASESIQYVFNDEPGKYPEFSGKEADPFSLAEMRTNAFPFTKKIMNYSTPVEDGNQFTELRKNDCDVYYRYSVPCPVCGHPQIMISSRLTWPEKANYKTVRRKKQGRYTCEKCMMDWTDAHRDAAVKKGVWVPGMMDENGDWHPSEPVNRPESVDFHLPAWYSPFISLSDCAVAKMKGMSDLTALMAYVTQYKAEPFRAKVETKNETDLLKHCSPYPAGVVPPDAVALTCGIDVQKAGFWFAVRAWGADLTSWMIQYGFLTDWEGVENLLYKTAFPRHGNPAEKMPIWRAAMDTGGGAGSDSEWSRTEEIYQWIRNQGHQGRVFGVKGASRPQIRRIMPRRLDQFPSSRKPIPGGLELRFLDVSAIKDILHWRLTRKETESQAFFLHHETGVDYARQFLAEEKRRDRRGKQEWVKIRKDNHLFDAEVYAAACADSEWMPSLMWLVNQQQAAKPEKQQTNPQQDQPKNPKAANRSRW